MDQHYYQAIKDLFNAYKLTLDINLAQDRSSNTSNLSFCLDDCVVRDLSFEDLVLGSSLPGTLDRNKLALAYMHVGQEAFLKLNPRIRANANKWYRLFGGLSLE